MKNIILFTAIIAVAAAAAGAAADTTMPSLKVMESFLPLDFILQNPDAPTPTEIDLAGLQNLPGLEPVNTTDWLLVYADNEPPRFINKKALEGT